jgi:hypothetical protein
MIQAPIDSNTAISVGLLIVLLTAAIKINSILKDITNELKTHSKTPEKIDSMEKSMIKLEGKVSMLEGDINNLWASTRTDDPKKLFESMRSKPRNRDDS